MSLCSGCGIALHATCASRSAHAAHVLPITALVKRGNTWLCNDCLAAGCDGCHTKDAALGLCLLGCCGCTKNFHLGCLDPMPVASTKPKCPWRCRHCMEHHVKAGSRTNVGGRTAGGIAVSRKSAAGGSAAGASASSRRLAAVGHGRLKRYVRLYDCVYCFALSVHLPVCLFYSSEHQPKRPPTPTECRNLRRTCTAVTRLRHGQLARELRVISE